MMMIIIMIIVMMMIIIITILIHNTNGIRSAKARPISGRGPTYKRRDAYHAV